MSTNLSVPQLETKIANLGKGIKRSGRMSKVGKLAAIGAAVVTIGIGANNIKNDEKAVQENTAVPAAIALAGFGTAVGAGKSRKNKTIDLRQAEADLTATKQKEAEEKRLAELKKREEIRKAAELEEAQKAEEKAKTRLSDLDRIPNQAEFYFDYELDSFGVVDKKPFKKEGGNWETGKPVPGRNYAEYYKTKDGCTVVAGIKYASVPKGCDCKDYTYRYVKVLDPTVKDVVCETGQLGYINEKGFAVSRRIEKVLYSYKKDWRTLEEERQYGNGKDFYAVKSNVEVAYFPKYEQQLREQVMNDAIDYLVGWGYKYPTYSTNCAFDPTNGQGIYK